MRLIVSAGGWACFGASVLAAWFAWSASERTVDVVWVGAVWTAFSLALLFITLPAALVGAWTSRWRRLPDRARWVDGWVLAGLLCALYFVRIEPAHQMVGPHRYMGLAGLGDLLLLFIAGAAVVASVARGGPGVTWLSRWGTVFVVVVCLEGAALLQTPSRDRSASAGGYPATVATGVAPSSEERVLFVGIDGLDWELLAAVSRQGGLPTFDRVIRDGRRWSLDTAGLKRSPETWASIHSGTVPMDHGVGGFADWVLFGGLAVVRQTPFFGPHIPFFLDHLLGRLPSAVCDFRLSTGEGLARPAFWELAAHSGLPVAVVSPYPFASPLLAVGGVMAVLDVAVDGWFVGTTFNGRSTVTPLPSARLEVPAPSDDDDADLWGLHDERVAMATRLFSREGPRLGVFYTSVLDETPHRWWRDDCGWFSLCRPSLEEFAGGQIAKAYRRVDEDLHRVLEAFGPATVVLVSDHGWTLDGNEHVFGPDGVLVVSPAAVPGFGGRSDIYRVAPTVLSLLGLPVETDMLPLTVDGLPVQQREARVLPRIQLRPAPAPSTDRLNLLKSVGYIAR